MRYLGALGAMVEKSVVPSFLKLPTLEETVVSSVVSICGSVIFSRSVAVIYSAFYIVGRIVQIALDFFSSIDEQQKKLESEALQVILKLREIRKLEDLNEEDFRALKKSLEESHSLVSLVHSALAEVAQKLGKKVDDILLAIYEHQALVKTIRKRVESERQLSASIRARFERIDRSVEAFAKDVENIIVLDRKEIQNNTPRSIEMAW